MSVAAPTVLIDKHDSEKFRVTHAMDPAIELESEGGWKITRARFTKRPPRVFTLAFTDLSTADKDVLVQLYNDTRGSSEIITGWVDPTDAQQAPISVRFKQGTIPEYTYKGKGGNHRWDVSSVVLEEV